MAFTSTTGTPASPNDIISYITRTGSSMKSFIAVVEAVEGKSMKVRVFEDLFSWANGNRTPNGFTVRTTRLTNPLFVHIACGTSAAYLAAVEYAGMVADQARKAAMVETNP